MTTRPLLPLLLLLAALFLGCAPAEAPATTELTLFAAASLTDAMTEMGAAYEVAHPGTTVRFSFGASSQLATQLIEGAPADIFASANTDQMARVVAEGRIAAEQVQPFAANSLVVILPADNPAAIESLADLARPGLKVVTTIPDAPIGRYTMETLAKMDQSGTFPAGFNEAVQANIVSQEETVRLVVTKVRLGEADAAIVYRSDVTPDARDELQTIPIDEAYNVQALYPIAPLQGSAHEAEAAAFIDFVRGDEGRAILQKWGFQEP